MVRYFLSMLIKADFGINRMRTSGSSDGSSLLYPLICVLGRETFRRANEVSSSLLFPLSYSPSDSGQKVTQVLQLVLASLGLDIGLSSGVLHYFLTLPNSRTNETEADNIGLTLASSACYDPREAVGLWERMAKAQAAVGGGAPPQFLSTHPSDTKRIEKIKRWLPEVSLTIHLANLVDGKTGAC